MAKVIRKKRLTRTVSRVNISISPQLSDRLTDYSVKCGLTKSAIVGFALNQFFVQQDSMTVAGEAVSNMMQNDPERFAELVKKLGIDTSKL